MSMGRNYAKFKDAGYSFEEISRIFSSTPAAVRKHYKKHKLNNNRSIKHAHFQPFKSIYGKNGYERTHLILSSMDFGRLLKMEAGGNE